MHKKHIQCLERLCQKLQFRYGDEDDLVIQLNDELEVLGAEKSRNYVLAHQGPHKQFDQESTLSAH